MTRNGRFFSPLAVYEQLFHAALQPVDRQREHIDRLLDVKVALPPIAAIARRLLGVEPDEMIIVLAKAPDLIHAGPARLAGAGIVALFCQLVHIHQRVADQNDLIVAAVVLQDPVGRDGVLTPHPRVGIHARIDAVVEIVDVQLLEVIGLLSRLKEHGAKARVILHRAARVHQHQHLHAVAARALVADGERAGIVAGIADGAVHVEFGLLPHRLRRILAQQAEGHLELADIKDIVLSEVAVLALPRDLKGAAIHTLSAHADPLRTVAAVAEVRIAARADPVRAAVVLLGLLPEALFKHSEDLLDGLFLVALRFEEAPELLQRVFRVVQPVQKLFGQVALVGHAVEVFQEYLVEFVVIRLGLDEHRAAKLVKARKRGVLQIQHQSLHQRHPLVQADTEAMRAQKIEKSSKHGALSSQAALDGRDILVLFQQHPDERDILRNAGRIDPRELKRADPVDKLGRGRLFLHRVDRAQIVKCLHRLREQRLVDMVKVHADDLLHLLLVGKVDIMEDTAAQEGVGQLLFRVRGDDDDGAVPGADGLLRLGDIELHLVELPEKVVREFKVRLVDLVDEQHDLLIGGKGLAELAELDIFCNIIHAGCAELAVV
jgi:hypothetical protein